jgi:hypothetical protein
MEIFAWIIFGVIGWILFGSIAIGAIDKDLEITNWKKTAVWWLVLLMNLFWPTIVAAYLIRNKQIKKR